MWSWTSRGIVTWLYWQIKLSRNEHWGLVLVLVIYAAMDIGLRLTQYPITRLKQMVYSTSSDNRIDLQDSTTEATRIYRLWRDLT
jgi:hypothetical protein